MCVRATRQAFVTPPMNPLQSPVLGDTPHQSNGVVHRTPALIVQLSRLQHSPSVEVRACACLSLQALLPRTAAPGPYLVSASPPLVNTPTPTTVTTVTLNAAAGSYQWGNPDFSELCFNARYASCCAYVDGALRCLYALVCACVCLCVTVCADSFVNASCRRSARGLPVASPA